MRLIVLSVRVWVRRLVCRRSMCVHDDSETVAPSSKYFYILHCSNV